MGRLFLILQAWAQAIPPTWTLVSSSPDLPKITLPSGSRRQLKITPVGGSCWFPGDGGPLLSPTHLLQGAHSHL